MVVINRKPVEQYFPEDTKRRISLQPLEVTDRQDKYCFKIRVTGGGVAGQAEAVRHGIARALEQAEPELRGTLKKAGFLTRDPRVVERKKPGRHKARKKPQFSKR
jgi:small subunit ribosomal protein S9